MSGVDQNNPGGSVFGSLETFGAFGTKRGDQYIVSGDNGDDSFQTQVTIAVQVPANTTGTQSFRGYSDGTGIATKTFIVRGITTENEWFPQLFSDGGDLS